MTAAVTLRLAVLDAAQRSTGAPVEVGVHGTRRGLALAGPDDTVVRRFHWGDLACEPAGRGRVRLEDAAGAVVLEGGEAQTLVSLCEVVAGADPLVWPVLFRPAYIRRPATLVMGGGGVCLIPDLGVLGRPGSRPVSLPWDEIEFIASRGERECIVGGRRRQLPVVCGSVAARDAIRAALARGLATSRRPRAAPAPRPGEAIASRDLTARVSQGWAAGG